VPCASPATILAPAAFEVGQGLGAALPARPHERPRSLPRHNTPEKGCDGEAHGGGDMANMGEAWGCRSSIRRHHRRKSAPAAAPPGTCENSPRKIIVNLAGRRFVNGNALQLEEPVPFQ